MFLFLKMINDKINNTRYIIALTAIETPKFAYSNDGIPPNKYSLKFQHIVGKKLRAFTLNAIIIELINELKKYNNNETVIDKALLPVVVLIKNAKVNKIRYSGKTESVCNPTIAKMFIWTAVCVLKL